jgi:hypothetical protein
MIPILSTYQAQIESALRAGNATEHTHRPALKTLIESIGTQVTATNEPKRATYGAPDYVIQIPRAGGLFTLGYIEAKDINKPLDDILHTDQLKRYTTHLENLVLTDYLEFRWFVKGEHRLTARLATPDKTGRLHLTPHGDSHVQDLLTAFLTHQAEPISSPEALAARLAHFARMIREIIKEAFEREEASPLLTDWRQTFAKILLPDLAKPDKTGEFADMIAQTLAYGLFTARAVDTTPDSFTRAEAIHLIPKTNPFLRKFFESISGTDLADEPYVGFVDDLVGLLAQTDMERILARFGERTRRQDPTLHFYETFLAAYDPTLREQRGVYYTPEPVVDYMVRAVDHILRDRFDCRDGLAERKTADKQVLILDPACGTGTFLYSVIDHIRAGFMERGNAGMWGQYVRDHLIPRLYGFELMMTPYAVAHLKLGLQLAGRDLPAAQRAEWSADLEGKHTPRLGIYLTNALETIKATQTELSAMRWLTEEGRAANNIKETLPLMVIMGNPPYSGHSSNNSEWISGLLRGKSPGGSVPSYYDVDGKPLGEKNPKWLQDDYVKFIRFGQYRIEQQGAGILAFITNHGFLDNPTFRGMREKLFKGFSEIYFLNLHGNSKKKEQAPDGGKDENVFDIQQGVTISLFVKRKDAPTPATIYYADLWGKRQVKYEWLGQHDLKTTAWQVLKPSTPEYFFVPQLTSESISAEYKTWFKVTEIFPVNVLGFQTHRDDFAIAYDRETMVKRVRDMRDGLLSDADFGARYEVKDSGSWKIAQARKGIRDLKATWEKPLIQCAYRPFDTRWSYYSQLIMDRPRRELLDHVAGKNNLVGLFMRQMQDGIPHTHFFVSNTPPIDRIFACSRGAASAFPLYLTDKLQLEKRIPNLSPAFVTAFSKAVGLAFLSDGRGNLTTTYGPEDVFHYCYAVLHRPSYRERYAELLKTDFPRIPLPASVESLRRLCQFGARLVGLHLLTGAIPEPTRFPIKGDNTVAKTYPKYDPTTGRVSINKTQYVEGVSAEVWEFQVGGYQVCEKWLRDRVGRALSYDELIHYGRVVGALGETLSIMTALDAEDDS